MPSVDTSCRSSSSRRTNVELLAIVGCRPMAKYITRSPPTETRTARKIRPNTTFTPRLATADPQERTGCARTRNRELEKRASQQYRRLHAQRRALPLHFDRRTATLLSKCKGKP